MSMLASRAVEVAGVIAGVCERPSLRRVERALDAKLPELTLSGRPSSLECSRARPAAAAPPFFAVPRVSLLGFAVNVLLCYCV